MKTQLLPLIAVATLLAACGAPQTVSKVPAAAQDGAAAHATSYKVKALAGAGSSLMPFFKMTQLQANLEDVDANADFFNGVAATDAASTIAFNLVGKEQLDNSGAWNTTGQIEFQDRTHNLSFKGQVSDQSAFLSEQILYANLSGPLAMVDQAVPDDDKPGCDRQVDWSWSCDRDKPQPKGNCQWEHKWSRDKRDCHRSGYHTQGLGSFLASFTRGARNTAPNATSALDLDNAYTYTLEVGETDPYQVLFTFRVFKVGETTPVYQYSGLSDKGKLKLMLK